MGKQDQNKSIGGTPSAPMQLNTSPNNPVIDRSNSVRTGGPSNYRSTDTSAPMPAMPTTSYPQGLSNTAQQLGNPYRANMPTAPMQMPMNQGPLSNKMPVASAPMAPISSLNMAASQMQLPNPTISDNVSSMMNPMTYGDIGKSKAFSVGNYPSPAPSMADILNQVKTPINADMGKIKPMNVDSYPADNSINNPAPPMRMEDIAQEMQRPSEQPDNARPMIPDVQGNPQISLDDLMAKMQGKPSDVMSAKMQAYKG